MRSPCYTSNMENNVRVSIAPQAVILVLGSLLTVWLAFTLRDVIVLFLVVLAVTVGFSPLVKAWEKFIPRTLAIVIIYLLVIALISAILALFIPPVLSQLSDFLGFVQHKFLTGYGQNDAFLSDLRGNINNLISGRDVSSLSSLYKQFQGSFGAVFTTTIGFIGGIVAIVTIFISSFYLLLEENNLERFLGNFMGDERRKSVMSIIEKMSQKIGDWLRGQLLLMLIIGVVDGVILALLGVPYPLLLGLWAGLTEAIPVIGTFLGAIPAVIIALVTLGWVEALIVLVVFIVIQQIENHILVPRIMGKALGLSPVMIIFSLLIWGQLLGFLGVLIAIPVTAALSVLVEEWRTTSRKDSK